MDYQKENALNLLEFRAKHVPLWEKQSIQLKAASDVVYSKLVEANNEIRRLLDENTDDENLGNIAAGLNQVWMLTVGYSIESLVKAIIIATTTKPIILNDKFNMKIFGNSSRSHDLHYLLQRKIDSPYKPVLSSEQNAFLLKITAYTTWRGKYPVPKDPMDQLRYLGPDSEQLYVDLGPARLPNNKDRTSFMAIFDLLYAKLQEAKENKA